MRITFCLPQPGNHPIGGYKVIYEYANRLFRKGYQVNIVYDCNRLFYKDKLNFIRRAKIMIKYNRRKSWFRLEKGIRLRYALNGINNEAFPDADYVVTSAIETVEGVYRLSPQKGKKIYFVQDIENWRLGDDYVNKTYALPFTKIAISAWIKKRVDQFSETPTVVIPNGLDFDLLGVDCPIKTRKKASVSMLYHVLEHKGSKYGIEALLMLKKDFPELEAEMFGVPDRPADLPDWVHYTQKANSKQLKEIYNKTAIFICPTIYEGFGLTGAESMACGCALVTTDYEGAKEYAVNDRNAIICKTKDSNELYLAMKKLIENDEMRYRIAAAGAEDIKKLSWDRSIAAFEEVLKD